jgi:uncharacterized protein
VEATSLLVPAVLILVGMVGIVVPVLPGLILVVAGVLFWSLTTGTALAWSVFGVAVLLYLAGLALQYAIPGRHLRVAGVRSSTMVLAVLLGIVGFFVVPVVGGPLGFVLAIYLVELARTNDGAKAWTSTRAALGAVLLSVGIELLAGMAIIVTWLVGVAASA